MTERAPVNLDQFKEKLAEDYLLQIQAGSKVFTVRNPALLSDDEYQALLATDGDAVAQARLVLDDYDGFVAAGGSALLLGAILKEQNIDLLAAQGASPGESEPS